MRAHRTGAVWLIILLLAPPAQAQEARVHLSIPAQALSSGLLRLGEQAHVSIAVPEDLIAGRMGAAVSGEMSIRAALTQLLGPAGLSFEFVNPEAVRIIAIPAPRPQASSAPNPRIEPKTELADVNADVNATVAEVVVTAQRRDEPMLDVPISMSSLSADQIMQMGATDFESYAGTVPGLSYAYVGPLGYRGTRTLALRGISGNNTVGFYIDEAPLPILDPKLLDLDRIEVLRGPQATLYGSNSMGGTIKLVTTQPDATAIAGHLETDVSSTDGGDRANNRFAGTVNLPIITDVLAARISLSRASDSGFINNYYDGYPGFVNNSVPPYGLTYSGIARAWNSEVADTARVVFKFTPNDRLTITPSVFYNSDSIGANDYYYSSLPNLSIQRYFPTPESERFTLTNVTATYGFDTVSIVDSTTYSRHLYSGLEDLTQQFPVGGYQTPTPVGLTTVQDDDIFTEEVRAQTQSSGTLNGLLGAVYSRDDTDGSQSSPDPGLSAFNPALPPVPLDQIFLNRYIDSVAERDVYGELRYKPLPRLELTAGARYYDFNIHSSRETSGLFGNGPSAAQSTESGVRPRGTLSWQLADDLLLYANYAKGFRPGGTNPSLPSICSNPGQFSGGGYKSDDVRSYDAGIKAALLEHRMELTLSGYLMKWTGIQQPVLLPCGIDVTVNTGQATSDGMELEGKLRPVAPLTLDFEATYAYTNLDTAQPGNYALQGDPILNVPRWKSGVGAQYDRKVTGRWSGFGRMDYDYQSSAYLNYGDRPTIAPLVRAAYGTLGLHLGVQDDRWRTELYGSNLSNEHPITNAYTFALPANTSEYSTIRPRTVGLKLAYRF